MSALLDYAEHCRLKGDPRETRHLRAKAAKSCSATTMSALEAEIPPLAFTAKPKKQKKAQHVRPEIRLKHQAQRGAAPYEVRAQLERELRAYGATLARGKPDAKKAARARKLAEELKSMERLLVRPRGGAAKPPTVRA